MAFWRAVNAFSNKRSKIDYQIVSFLGKWAYAEGEGLLKVSLTLALVVVLKSPPRKLHAAYLVMAGRDKAGELG